ncbi:MAG TPA: hypothetical protein VK616_10230 [Flavitalea sp.]|nr:hypothetical protein [Flavitalea sp.]HTF29929.1 hypothetical protein [Flavitalea sp.]
MNKKVLAVYYTQSGQLKQILDNFTAPFTQAGMTVETVSIQPKSDYPFPWTTPAFFDVMPESVLGIPTEIVPFQCKEASYDLVIFAYQPWFLSPSIPANSLLQNPSFKALIKGTPVITLIGSRNMWISSQERVKKFLKDAGANLVGNSVLIDRNQNHISVVTIFHWMLTGRKDRYLNIFPKPGVSDEDIRDATNFGATAAKHLQENTLSSLQDAFIAQKAVEVHYNLLFIEERGSKLFRLWAKLISRKKNRTGWLVAFKYYLLIALFVAAPIVLTVFSILFRPFLSKSIKRKKQYYLALN